MKKLLLSAAFIFVLTNGILAQGGHCEIGFRNDSPRWVYIKVFPVSMIFNYPRENSINYPGYNIISRVKRFGSVYPPITYTYINGWNALEKMDKKLRVII
ncbi:MAG: hypothetical protein K8I03_12760 [Ignavibacteria bacterium]|nr:hypothetical protein [Ignavibacteria bacterium]